MTFLNKQLYALLKADVTAAKAWFEAQELHTADYHDIIAFRVGHVLGNKVEEDNIKSDLVRNLCEFESVVHFAKITKRLERPNNADTAPYSTMTYSYRTGTLSAGKLLDGSTTYFNQTLPCKYMPTNTIVPFDYVGNTTGEEVLLSRETSGKHVCDVIDAIGSVGIQSNLRGLSQEYEENKISLPVINQIEVIPDYVIKSLSLLASVADGNYRHDSANRAFNGVVVTPILIMYSRITNLYNTVIKY